MLISEFFLNKTPIGTEKASDFGENMRHYRRTKAFLLVFYLGYLSCSPALAFLFFKKHHHHHDNEEADDIIAPAVVTSPPPSLTPLTSSPPKRFYPLTTQHQDIKKHEPPILRSSQPWTPSVPAVPLSCPIAISGQSHLIRVGLALNSKNIEISSTIGARLINASDGKTVAFFPGQTRWQVSSDGTALVFQMRQLGQSNKMVAKATNKYDDPYGIDNSSLTFDSTTSRPDKVTYAPAYNSEGHYGSNVQSIQQVAYFPSAPVSTDPDLTSNKYLRLPMKTNVSSASLPSLTGNNSALQSGYFVVADKADAADPCLITFNGKPYRGCLLLCPATSPSGFNVINYLDIEDYLLSVVPSEMPSSWSSEALKAQAVAARSYALANLGKHGKDGYDVKDTTDDQVYSGIKSEAKSTNLAVTATKGLVLTYDGKPICAYFHSTSGGSTELAENVWSKPLPYLKSVLSQDQQSPHYSWNRKFSVAELEGNIAPEAGKLLSMFVISRTPTQRATYLLFVGSNGTRIFPAETVRRILNLPSSNFNVTPSDQAYTFAGHGFGHGLGLSQWGAKTLAEQGYNAEQILKYYYKDVSVEHPGDVFGS